jgi:glutathione S-transferase
MGHPMNQKPESPPIQLLYFGVRGRIEPARLMLELAGAPYEFTEIPVQTWATAEGKQRFYARTPLGQLPVLQEGDFVLCQSTAIYRYLGGKLGLYGSTAKEGARVDEVTETAGDLLMDLGLLFWDPNFAARRAEHRESFGKKLAQVQDYFGRVSPDGEHWVLPGRHTFADIRMAYALETAMPLHPGLLESFPKLYHIMNTFFLVDGVRQYVRSERRPRTYTVARASFAGKPEETHHF